MPYAPKRKRDECDDDSDEELSPGKQILPVANLPEDFDGVPEDGLQYLFTVRRDARHLPFTTRVTNPYELKDPSPARTDESGTATIHHLLPHDEWRKLFEEHFRNFRKNMATQTTDVHDASQKLMPDKRERDLWWAFIAGRPESDWNPPKKPKQTPKPKGKGRNKPGKMRGFTDDQDEHATDSGALSQETWRVNEEGEVELSYSQDATPAPLGPHLPVDTSTGDRRANVERVLCTGNENQEVPSAKMREPTPSLVSQVDSRMSLHLLMYFAHWINLHLDQPSPSPSYLTETHARWIFVLLSRVEDYVTADDMSLLRSVARSCLSLLKRSLQKGDLTQSNLPEPQMGERSCWMIISVIASIWGQQDLWDEAKDMLAELKH